MRHEGPSPLLLSRVAESAFWAGRYLERAEGTARLVKTTSDLIVDLPRAANVSWNSLLALVGIDEPEVPLLDDATSGADLGASTVDRRALEAAIVHRLTADADNPSSVRRSVASVHHNLRVTRAVMPIEAAEILTDLHNRVEATVRSAVPRSTRGRWLSEVIRGCQTLSGVLAETMNHDDAFCFFTVGRQLERADLTTRVLDVQFAALTGAGEGEVEAYAEIVWAAALRSVSALQAFRRGARVSSGPATVGFLLGDPKCPRTVSACLTEASRWLLEIPGHEQAIAASARAERMVLDAVPAEILGDGSLHDFAHTLQQAIGEVHEEVARTWFSPIPAEVAG